MSMCESKHDVGAADGLDELIADFMAWQQHTIRVASENHALTECIAEKDKQLKQSEERYCVAKQEQRGLQEVVTQLQEILKKRCDLEDQNIVLSTELKELNEQMKQNEKRHAAEVLELKRTAEDMQLAHSVEMADREERCRKKAAGEKEELVCEVKMAKQQVEHLEQQIAAQERDKQAHLVKLRLEYDAKLLKLQTQNAKNQQHTSQGAGVSQDIFRKKLQHQREEYEREISGLKRRIGEMEQKLGGQQDSGGPAVCKRRKVNFHRS